MKRVLGKDSRAAARDLQLHARSSFVGRLLENIDAHEVMLSPRPRTKFPYKDQSSLLLTFDKLPKQVGVLIRSNILMRDTSVVGRTRQKKRE